MRIEWRLCTLNYRYEISSHGFVRNAETKKILKPYILKGYFRITLAGGKSGVKKNHLISRLVLLAFEGPSDDPDKIQAAHKDGNSFNNQADNLIWKSALGNAEDRIVHGTTNRKLTEEDVFIMRNYYANGMTQAELSKRFNTSRSNVSLIVNGHRWKT